jgi:hypothetical protein
LNHFTDFHEISYGGNVIQGGLDAIIFNPTAYHFKMVEVHICELDARFSALLINGLGLFALLGYHGYIT